MQCYVSIIHTVNHKGCFYGIFIVFFLVIYGKVILHIMASIKKITFWASNEDISYNYFIKNKTTVRKFLNML